MQSTKADLAAKTTANAELAARAKVIADAAGRGPDRKAALSAAVALGTTGTITSARKALGFVPPDIRQAAERLIDHLTSVARQTGA